MKVNQKKIFMYETTNPHNLQKVAFLIQFIFDS